MKDINQKKKLSLITVTTLSIACLFLASSCEKKEEVVLDNEIVELFNDDVREEVVSSKVEYTDTSIMNETDFDNGSLSPFYIRNTEGGNTVEVISQRAKFNWEQSNYNSRLTRDFKGAEIASYIEFTEEVYVGFKLYVPETTGSITFPDNRNTTIAQILSAGGTCSSWSGMLEIKNNDLYISHRNYCTTGTVVKILSDIPRNEWIDIQIRWVPSNDNHGAVQIKYNGDFIYNQRSLQFAWGTFSEQNILNGEGNNYMQVKYGMYCHDADSYTDSAYENDSRTLYLDNVSVRQGSDGWDDTDPSN